MITIGELVDRYFEGQAAKGAPSLGQMQRTWQRCQGLINYGRQPIAKAVADRLDGQKLIKWFARLQESLPVTVANEVAKILSAALHAAQKRGDLPQGPLPSALLPRYQSKPKTGAIPLAKIPDVLADLRLAALQKGATADETRRLRLPFQALALYLYTAARAEELRQVRLQDVVEIDGAPGLRLAKTKDGLPHFLALSPNALAIVQDILAAHPHKTFNAYLLQPTKAVQKPISAETIARAWRSVQAGNGLTGLTLHDLRRTAASALATAGEGVETVDQYLNHQKLSAVQRCYFQPQTARLLQIACRLEEIYKAPPAPQNVARCKSLVFGVTAAA